MRWSILLSIIVKRLLISLDSFFLFSFRFFSFFFISQCAAAAAATNSKNQIKSYQFICGASITHSPVISQIIFAEILERTNKYEFCAFNFISLSYTIPFLKSFFFPFSCICVCVCVCMSFLIYFRYAFCVVLAKLLLRLIYQNILKGWNINTFPEEKKEKMTQIVVA